MTLDDSRPADQDAWFWSVVHRANRSRAQLRELLSKLRKDELYRFQDTFLDLATELQYEPYTQHINSAESEDGIADISYWVVSQGESTYAKVLANPELIPSHVDVASPENLFPVAYDVYFERFGEPLEIM